MVTEQRCASCGLTFEVGDHFGNGVIRTAGCHEFKRIAPSSDAAKPITSFLDEELP
jgi:hypothetical protein